jgi:hypothetical protein
MNGGGGGGLMSRGTVDIQEQANPMSGDQREWFR